jgi:exonuclease-1
MGIQGLLPCLRSVSRAAHVREYAGQRVAVDSYVWLHRGAFTCARELALGLPTDRRARARAAPGGCGAAQSERAG